MDARMDARMNARMDASTPGRAGPRPYDPAYDPLVSPPGQGQDYAPTTVATAGPPPQDDGPVKATWRWTWPWSARASPGCRRR